MSIAIGGDSVSKIYVGSTEITKAYIGDTLVYGGQQPTPSGYYYIYRTSSNIIERRDIAQYPTVNFPAIAGNSYGGVFTDYGGKGTIATALANGDPVTFVDDRVQDNGIGYIGESNVSGATQMFNVSDAITTGTTAYTPTVGAIYYVKEVPDWGLALYHQTAFASDRNTLIHLLCITGVDSTAYSSVKLYIKKEGDTDFEEINSNFSSSIKIQTNAGGSYVTLKANTVFKSKGCVTDVGYLGSYDIISMLEENTNYIFYFELTTPDGISIHSPYCRKLMIETLTKRGVTKEEIPFEPITYDAQVEYIETSSDNCNIPIDETDGIKFEIDAYIPPTTTSGWLFGSMIDVDNKMYAFTPCDENSLSSYKLGNASSQTELKLEGRYTFSNMANVNECVVTNGTDTITYVSTGTNSRNYLITYLLGLNFNSAGRKTIKGIKLYSAKFYSAGTSATLVKDFIPVRKDGRGYLYDKVDGLKLYAPKGDPITVYGADVVENE